MKLANDEFIVRKGAATYLVPSEGVGGKLFLTSQRLFFEPHSFNFQRHERSIRLEQIIKIEAKYSDFLSRKLSIYLTNKSVEELIVYKRKTWVSEIQKAIMDIQEGTTASASIPQRPVDFTPAKGHNFYINLLIRAIIIGIFVGILMYLLL